MNIPIKAAAHLQAFTRCRLMTICVRDGEERYYNWRGIEEYESCKLFAVLAQSQQPGLRIVVQRRR